MKIIIKNLQKTIPISQRKIQRAALKVLSLEGVYPVRNTKPLGGKRKISNGAKLTGEITILFVGDQEMRELNLLYLGCDSPTDVISFNNSVKENELLADIAISTETAIGNARRFKSGPQDEILRYVIHGILHILDYDDNNNINKRRMHRREEYLLRAAN